MRPRRSRAAARSDVRRRRRRPAPAPREVARRGRRRPCREGGTVDEGARAATSARAVSRGAEAAARLEGAVEQEKRLVPTAGEASRVGLGQRLVEGRHRADLTRPESSPCGRFGERSESPGLAAVRGRGSDVESERFYAVTGSGRGSTAGAGRSSASCSSRGSHSSHLGRYQFQSPRSFIADGSSTARTIVASSRIRGGEADSDLLHLDRRRASRRSRRRRPSRTPRAVTAPVVLIPCATAAASESRPRSRPPHPAEDEDVVVHRQPEQDHEHEQR